jgi:exonuclease VII small subunit
LKAGSLEADGLNFMVFLLEREDINLDKALKQYWVLVKRLPLKLSIAQHMQKSIEEVGDVLEVN